MTIHKEIIAKLPPTTMATTTTTAKKTTTENSNKCNGKWFQ